ncbi:MAG: aminopeptidase [Sulfobacillus sp.]
MSSDEADSGSDPCCPPASGPRGFDSPRGRQRTHSAGTSASMTHADFLTSSADVSIDATTTDGRTVPVFRSGNWAQDL